MSKEQGKRYRAIFWDNDGVLVDTEKLFFESNRRILRDFGIDLTWEHFAEVSLRHGASILELAGRPAAEYAGLVARRNAVYAEILSETDSRTLIRPGALEVLKHFHGRIIMGIVSSCRRLHFDLIHRNTGIPEMMDFILLLEDCPNNKPLPDPYLLAMKHTGLKPEDCVVVEDAERGLIAAHAAGIDVIAAPEDLSFGGDFSLARVTTNDLCRLPDYISF